MRIVQEILSIVSILMVTVCMNRIVNLALIVVAISMFSNVSLHVHECTIAGMSLIMIMRKACKGENSWLRWSLYKHHVQVWWALNITNREMGQCAWEFLGQGSFQVEWYARSGFWWSDQSCSWWEQVPMCYTWVSVLTFWEFHKRWNCWVWAPVQHLAHLHAAWCWFPLHSWMEPWPILHGDGNNAVHQKTFLSWLLRGLFGCGGDDEHPLLIKDCSIFDSLW